MLRGWLLAAAVGAAAFALASEPQVEAARGVLERTMGREVAQRFDLRLMPSSGGSDVFELEARGGRVWVRGTSGVALTRGAYTYLKEACAIQVSWSDHAPRRPARFPDFALRRVESPVQFRHYFNVCTFGYTTVWWDWKRWEREIDWMALHGINMPLAMNGQEAVWQEVWQSFGVPQASIDRFVSGPAFLPWHRMGNLDGHMGPLPQSWLRDQVELQKRILARQRSLGMTPVVPGFSGFVPTDLARWVPGVKLDGPTAWAGFEPTAFVDVRDPMFIEIGKRFVAAYRRTFGSDHHYLCDTFNEQNPKFPAASKLHDLAGAGEAVYRSLTASDPEAVWVMQGWLFYNARDYWGRPEVEALLSRVPQGRMIILDLACEEYPVWKVQPELGRVGWIHNTLHNYGQNTAMYGDLDRMLAAARDSLSSPDRGRLLGMGLTMEGIDQNPVVYELMCDAMWSDGPKHVDAWLPGYVRSRYGSTPSAVMEAWKLLRREHYGSARPWARKAWRGRPGWGRAEDRTASFEANRRAAELLLQGATLLARSSNYRRDLVDVTKEALGDALDTRLFEAGMAFHPEAQAGHELRRAAVQTVMETFDDLDRLMATRPEHRLSTWVRDARRHGHTPSEKAHMEANARMQVTVWGGPVLFDYANKEWAGLNRSFLKERWRRWFDALLEGAGLENPLADQAEWELAWAMSGSRLEESRPEDEVAVVRELLGKYRTAGTGLLSRLGLPEPERGLALGKPVRDSGGTEAGHPPSVVTDGNPRGAYWAASPAPQWIEIDLEAASEVGGVHLYPYWGDGRVYKYVVEGSLDGIEYQTLVDASENRASASPFGHRHAFSAQVRYLRVRMLENSANIGVHLHEVVVLPPS